MQETGRSRAGMKRHIHTDNCTQVQTEKHKQGKLTGKHREGGKQQENTGDDREAQPDHDKVKITS